MSCLLSVYGPNSVCAYNIGCVFASTINNSGLATKVPELNLHFMVGALHGHVHNCLCQLDWHPIYIEGTGNTEGEECEHVFLASNKLAWGTCHVSHFHWHQAIEQHFAFWNVDKYEALSKSFAITHFCVADIHLVQFIQSHYWEVTELVHTLTVELTIVKDALDLADNDFLWFIIEEWVYLTSLKQHPQQDLLKVQYVQVLDELGEQK